jgi:type III restriction enzyme
VRLTLKDYQSDAVTDVLTKLADARDDWHNRGHAVGFSLSAVTGAGKTVMASAVIEALFFGDDERSFEADPGAVVLWFTDDPVLNEQTRAKILDASGDRIAYSRLEVIGPSFSREKLDAGKVYFLNSQKLGKNSLLVRGVSGDDQDTLFDMNASPDLRAYTMWDTIRNTIQDERLTLYLILDEAHKGMRKPTTSEREEKQTIVRRLVNGAYRVPPVPVVLGISATVERFDEALREADNRYTYPSVVVDSARVQESGLLKDDIRLDFPAEAGHFDTVLLRRGLRMVKQATIAWQRYAREQANPADEVLPLMVLQVPNTPSETMIADAIHAIRDEWPELPQDAIAHVFGEHTPLHAGGHTIKYVSPEKVQDRSDIRVLLAKDAISTGWDCPRAEVMVSYRPALDKTHITQLLGRMVRTPLARRIPGDDVLNSVRCILPHFDRSTAASVAEILLGTRKAGDDGTGETGGGEGRRVLFKPIDMTVNAEIQAYVWEAFDDMPSQTLPRRTAKPTRRLSALAQALSHDALLPNARKEAQEELFAVLDGLMARYKVEVEENSYRILEVEGETIIATVTGGPLGEPSKFSEIADEQSVEADFKVAQRVLSADIVRKYAEHIAEPHGDDDGLFDAHIKVAALAKVEGVAAELDAAAGELAQRWLAEYRVAIKGLSDERKSVYTEITAMSREPQRIAVVRPHVRAEDTWADRNGTLAKTRRLHLMSDESGDFPIGSLNDWEVLVLDRELSRPDALAWYRSPSRASEDSLAIAYKDGKDLWRRMSPDFVFYHGNSDTVRVSIVDPHGFHLQDAVPKLRGLADYAESFGTEIHRIEAVARMKDGKLRVLDMKHADVRQAVRTAHDAETVYLSSVAIDY